MLDQQCGFVGMPLVGLSHLDDVRPHQQAIEPWDGPVEPERIAPGRRAVGPAPPAQRRERVARAGTAAASRPSSPLLYKVAWIGGCVLYDVAKLRAVGGFEFWRELPSDHCGEDVLAQLRVMADYGGCGVLPTGAFHQQLPTTVSRPHARRALPAAGAVNAVADRAGGRRRRRRRRAVGTRRRVVARPIPPAGPRGGLRRAPRGPGRALARVPGPRPADAARAAGPRPRRRSSPTRAPRSSRTSSSRRERRPTGVRRQLCGTAGSSSRTSSCSRAG